MSADYVLLDSGDGEKLERFGDVVLRRPSPQAFWSRRLGDDAWGQAWARYERSSQGGGQWRVDRALPEQWPIDIVGQRLLLKGTGFGHLGVFPEQAPFWTWIRERCQHVGADPVRLLNLFAYTGGSTLAAALGGAEATHCDASKGVVQWARENAQANALGDSPIRWIVDDALKFLRREARRERVYDAIVLDPPSFGRGPKGEVFKLEESIGELLAACADVLSDRAAFVLLSAHTPGLGSVALRHLLEDTVGPRGAEGCLAHGEMLVPATPDVRPLPSGTWASWSRDGSSPDPGTLDR
jgi:23S rRNA (cytosine1962-C5)-methyltransferase